MDVDEYDGTFGAAMDSFKDVKYIVYSSASSRPDKTKFRMVFPLDRHVDKVEIKHFWFALNKEFNSLGDPQTKDLSRMYYVPAVYPEANNFIYSNGIGATIGVSELIRQHPFTQATTKPGLMANLPEDVIQRMLEYRKSQLVNRDFSWTSFHDCPFVSRELISRYAAMSGIDGSGRYSKMYGIMVSIASSALRKGYPITPDQIAALCREIDSYYGSIYKSRHFEVEAVRAIDFALQRN